MASMVGCHGGASVPKVTWLGKAKPWLVCMCAMHHDGKRLAFGPPKGENMAAWPWHVHDGEQGGFRCSLEVAG
jgi:hypothetical protein